MYALSLIKLVWGKTCIKFSRSSLPKAPTSTLNTKWVDSAHPDTFWFKHIMLYIRLTTTTYFPPILVPKLFIRCRRLHYYWPNPFSQRSVALTKTDPKVHVFDLSSLLGDNPMKVLWTRFEGNHPNRGTSRCFSLSFLCFHVVVVRGLFFSGVWKIRYRCIIHIL